MGALQSGAGNNWRPKNPGTSVLGRLRGVEEGPPAQQDNGENVNLARWIWEVHSLEKVPMLDEDGKQVLTEGLSTPKISPKSKATRWLKAHLQREFSMDEDPDALVGEAEGKWAILTYTSGDKGLTLGMDGVSAYKED